MRASISLGLWLAVAAVAPGQAPGQPAVHLNPAGQASAPVSLNPQTNRLDALLMQWEQKMRTVQGLHATVTRTETDPVEKTAKTYTGEAKFLRPNRAMLYMKSTTDPNLYEQYVFTGTYLYEYSPQFKRLRIHELAPKAGQVVEDNFLNFLFGMSAEDAKRRYDMSLAKEDQHYVYLFVSPKTPADRADFSKARLVLWATTFLPRQLEFETPNGSVIKWDIPKADPAARVTATDFAPPTPPRDWQVQRVPRATEAPAGVAPVPPGGGTVQPQPTKVRNAGG
jgi:TIGR03009 family protein